MSDSVTPTAAGDAGTRQRLVECFREVFPELGDEQILSAEHAQMEAWDSLASITLVAVVEDEFECTLPDDLVGKLTSFDRIHTAVVDLTRSTE